MKHARTRLLAAVLALCLLASGLTGCQRVKSTLSFWALCAEEASLSTKTVETIVTITASGSNDTLDTSAWETVFGQDVTTLSLDVMETVDSDGRSKVLLYAALGEGDWTPVTDIVATDDTLYLNIQKPLKLLAAWLADAYGQDESVLLEALMSADALKKQYTTISLSDYEAEDVFSPETGIQLVQLLLDELQAAVKKLATSPVTDNGDGSYTLTLTADSAQQLTDQLATLASQDLSTLLTGLMNENDGVANLVGEADTVAQGLSEQLAGWAQQMVDGTLSASGDLTVAKTDDGYTFNGQFALDLNGLTLDIAINRQTTPAADGELTVAEPQSLADWSDVVSAAESNDLLTGLWEIYGPLFTASEEESAEEPVETDPEETTETTAEPIDSVAWDDLAED